MRQVTAVAGGDIHFSRGTLELASTAIKTGIQLARDHGVPLLINGDLLDEKSLIRGEVANRLIELFHDSGARIIVNTGNHDLLNEKASESSLNFLRPYCEVIAEPTFDGELESWIIPYQNSAENMAAILAEITPGSRLFVHQGVIGAEMGAYIKDNSSLSKEAYANFRVIASHYHKRQDIKCGKPRKGAVGLFSYLGSPYSTSFAEANEGPKGLNIIYDNGLLELVPLGLREHRIFEYTVAQLENSPAVCRRMDDIAWIKLSGPYSELQQWDKQRIAKTLGFSNLNFKLDRIVTESSEIDQKATRQMTDMEMLDSVIDSTAETPAQKAALKKIARELML